MMLDRSQKTVLDFSGTTRLKRQFWNCTVLGLRSLNLPQSFIHEPRGVSLQNSFSPSDGGAHGGWVTSWRAIPNFVLFSFVLLPWWLVLEASHEVIVYSRVVIVFCTETPVSREST
jgi:hypothetical protein